ncbi:MAG TPA: (Fe-S)-binding protein [Desulfomonilaceae bacterium]|nr:(Fe-S)-binding protein [Desulfomonilaceae bacterium]
MLIESYDLRIEVGKHSADEFEYEAIAHLPVDIRQVLPYLNAVYKNGTYYSDAPVFSWHQDDHDIAFWHDRIAVDHFETRDQASEMVQRLVKLVNDVWERRKEIEPDTTTRENLQPLELYRLLPRTNCKECGENSCFNFALKLAAGQVALGTCKPLHSDDAHQDRRNQLEALIATRRPLL